MEALEAGRVDAMKHERLAGALLGLSVLFTGLSAEQPHTPAVPSTPVRRGIVNTLVEQIRDHSSSGEQSRAIMADWKWSGNWK